MAWSYSDYVTYDHGAARLTRFRLHIQEVSDALSAEMGTRGRTYSTAAIQNYLNTLKAAEAEEQRRCNLSSGSTVAFTRARPRPTP